jgi:hypothetical protein
VKQVGLSRMQAGPRKWRMERSVMGRSHRLRGTFQCQNEGSALLLNNEEPLKIEEQEVAAFLIYKVVTNSSNLQFYRLSHYQYTSFAFVHLVYFIHLNAWITQPQFRNPQGNPYLYSHSHSQIPWAQIPYREGRKHSSPGALPCWSLLFVPWEATGGAQENQTGGFQRSSRLWTERGFMPLNTQLRKQWRSWAQHPARGFDLRLLGPLMSGNQSQLSGIIKAFFIISSYWRLNCIFF